MSDRNSGRARLIVISPVHPFPGASGQQQRVRNKLWAFREFFHTTFLTVAALDEVEEVATKLSRVCDEAIVLPSLYSRPGFRRLFSSAASVLYASGSGLKRSNYVIGKLDLAPARVAAAIGKRRFGIAVFEYWHTAAAVPELHSAGARCVLDMHNVLWRSYERQLRAWKWLLPILRKFAVKRYRVREETAWRSFDILITINREEHRYASEVLGDDVSLIYTPMGIDLGKWPYSWAPVNPPRVAYYGGLDSPHNRRDALFCFEKVMPAVWQRTPDAELWIIGSNPPPAILDLARRDPRVYVTGYVETVASLLGTMSVLLCPWIGTYGFRSRIVEAMAVGLPVVTSLDAVNGMNLVQEMHFLPGSSARQMASSAIRVLDEASIASELSARAREKVEAEYSFETTYGSLASCLASGADERGRVIAK